MDEPDPGVVDVFVGNHTTVEPDVYRMWLDGHSVPEAASYVLRRDGVPEGGGTGPAVEAVASDVSDHYRTYGLMEKFIHYPAKLDQQLEFQIEPRTRRILVEMYYEMDDIIVREFLGKKLSSKHLKYLDKVSEKTSIPIKSCRRQFDNIKRVFKAVKELKGSIIQNISNIFLLSEDLTKKYGVIVFMARMQIETFKRKLQMLKFPDFYEPTLCIMNKWTYPNPEFDGTDLDRQFLLDLREVKILLDKEKEHKHAVCQNLKPEFSEETYNSMEANFCLLSKPIIGIASNLHHNKDLRGFFLEVVEKIIDPWKMLSWTKTDVLNFLKVYINCAIELDVFKDAGVKKAWESYTDVISTSVKQMY